MKNPKHQTLNRNQVKGSFFTSLNSFVKPTDYGSTEPITIGKRKPIHAACMRGEVKTLKGSTLVVPSGLWAVLSYMPNLNLTIVGLIKL